MSKTKAKWTEAEDELLCKWWQTSQKLVHLAVMFPGRSPGSMSERARRLGLGQRTNVPRGGSSWTLIERELKGGQKTALQIGLALGMHSRKVMEILRSYRDQVYVADWTPPMHGGRARIFALGVNKIDKPRPPNVSRRDINRDYMRRVRKEKPEMADKWQSKYKNRKREERVGAKTDPAASWLNNNAETIRADEAHAVQETSQEEASLAQQDGAGRLPGASVFPVYSGSLLRGYGNGSASASQ